MPPLSTFLRTTIKMINLERDCLEEDSRGFRGSSGHLKNQLQKKGQDCCLLGMYERAKTLRFLVFWIVGSPKLGVYMLWFNFILGLNFIFFCSKLTIIHYHTQTQRKIKFKPRIKLNHNIYNTIYKKQTLFLFILDSVLSNPNKFFKVDSPT